MDLPSEAVQHPNQPQRPSHCRLAAQATPVEHEVCAYFLARDKGGEDDEDGSACIIGELQEDNLAEYPCRRQIRECTRSRRAATTWHQ